MTFKKMMTCAFGMALAAVLGATAAQASPDYPDGTMRIVVPWRAGGGTDSIARALAAPMEEISGQSVLVENITGGAGNAGMLAVKNADADGYTLLLNGSSDVTAPMVFRDAPYSLDDYVCIGGVYDTPVWIIAHKDQGFDDFGDFIEAAKAKPGELAIGVTALYAPDHIFAEALVQEHELDVRIIPFNGGAPLKKALIGNQVNAGVLIAPVMLNEVKDGIARVLVAGGSLENINYEPVQNAHTPSDYGLDVQIGMIRGFFMPKGVSQEVAAKAEEIIGEAAQSEAFKEFGQNFGFAPVWMSAEEYCAFMEEEGEIYRAMSE